MAMRRRSSIPVSEAWTEYPLLTRGIGMRHIGYMEHNEGSGIILSYFRCRKCRWDAVLGQKKKCRLCKLPYEKQNFSPPWL
jgi:hypothetical protein